VFGIFIKLENSDMVSIMISDIFINGLIINYLLFRESASYRK
jgi:hypothetical protein